MPPLSKEVSPLLTPEVTEALARLGIKTVLDYAQSELVHLSRTSGLPYKLLTTIRQCLLAQYAAVPTSAADLWREQGEMAALLPTGCSSVDTLLGGGVMTGELTELTGPPSSGKTQLCHSLAVAGVLETNSTILWVDSTAGLSAHRLRTTLSAHGATREEYAGVMKRVRVHQLFSVFDLMNLLENLSNRISSQSDWFHANLHLLLLDSLTPLLSPLLGGRGGQGHALLSHVASQLRSIAHEHSIAVVYTNNTVSDMGRNGDIRPSLGQSWTYVPHTRLFLSSSHPHTLHTAPTSHTHTSEALTEQRERERVATITKSSHLAVGVCTTFVITDHGVSS